MLENIPRNFYFMERLEGTEKRVQDENPMCQTYEPDDHAATHKSVDCEELTCNAMVNAHTVANSICSHRVLALGEVRHKEDPSSGIACQLEASCPQHAGEQLKFYDSTCRKAFCSKCVLLPEHNGELDTLLSSPS